MTTAHVLRGFSLRDRALIRLTTAPRGTDVSGLQELLEVAGTGLLYLGGDRFRTLPVPPNGSEDGAATGTGRLDPLFAAQALHARLPGQAFMVSVSPDFEHPYNYARRVLALDHFTAGRIGVVIGSRDLRHGVVTRARTSWTGTPASPRLAAEFAQVLRELWHSWPAEAIIADRESGKFADASLIRRINHRGAYSVDGPLNSPSSPQGEPPVAWHLRTPATEAGLAAEHTDLVIVDAERSSLLDGLRSLEPARQPDSEHQLRAQEQQDRAGQAGVADGVVHPAGRALIDVPVAGLAGALERLPGGTAGILLRLDDLDRLGSLTGDLSAALREGVLTPPAPQWSPDGPDGTLRERLGLTARPLDTDAFTPAFPAG